jgi:hypothetical protein
MERTRDTAMERIRDLGRACMAHLGVPILIVTPVLTLDMEPATVGKMTGSLFCTNVERVVRIFCTV